MTTPYEQIKGMFSEMAEGFLEDTCKFDVFIAGYRAGKEKERRNTNISEAQLSTRLALIDNQIGKAYTIFDELTDVTQNLDMCRGLLDIAFEFVGDSQKLLKDLSDDIWEGRMSA